MNADLLTYNLITPVRIQNETERKRSNSYVKKNTHNNFVRFSFVDERSDVAIVARL